MGEFVMCLLSTFGSDHIEFLSIHPDWKTALFADDTLFYVFGNTNNAVTKNLQAQTNKVQPWHKDWRILVNSLKTSVLIFSHKCTQNSNQTFSSPKLQHQLVLDINKHVIKKIINKAKITRYSIFPLLNRSSSLSLHTEWYLLKNYIKPIITYTYLGLQNFEHQLHWAWSISVLYSMNHITSLVHQQYYNTQLEQFLHYHKLPRTYHI